MAGSDEFLLRFKVDLTQAQASLKAFSAETRAEIAKASSIPNPQIPTVGPGFTGPGSTPRDQGLAFGAAQQSVLGTTNIGSLEKKLQRQIGDETARQVLQASSLEAHKRSLSPTDRKQFNSGVTAGRNVVKLASLESDQIKAFEQINTQMRIKSQTAAKQIAAEERVLGLTNAQAKAVEKQIAKRQTAAAVNTSPAANQARDEEIFTREIRKRQDEVIAAQTRRGLLANERANRDAGFFQAEGKFKAEELIEDQKILAAKRIAYNRALLANNESLLKTVGSGEVADQSSAAAIHGERARQLLADPATTNRIISDDTVSRKEAAIREGRVAENLAADKEYIGAKVQSATAHKKEGVLVEAGVSEKLATDKAYRAAVIQNTRAREIERLAIIQATTQEDVLRQAKIGAESASIRNKVRIAELELLSNQEALALKAQTVVLERQYNKALKESVATQLASNGQRLAAFNVRYGRGGINGNTGGDTASGALGAGALSSLTHILPTLALFAAAGGIVSSIKEAGELEIKLTNINFQLNEAGQSDSFGQVKKDILDLARETGVASTQIAETRYQVQGAFGSETLNGLSGKQLVDDQTKSVTQISALTGFDSQKVVDSITAVGLAFNVTGEQVGNASYQLEQKFGVRAQETLDFLGDIAPVAKQAGFSLEEFATIAAVAQQRSGQSGSAIAEKFSRAITGISEKKNDLIKVISDSSSLSGNDALLKSIDTNNIRGILLEIGKVFNQLDTVTQDKLSNVLGGPRNFQAILPALQSGDIEEKAKGVDLNLNTLEQRFNKFNETFSQQMKQFGEALQQIGIAIYDAGLKDVLSILVDVLKTFAVPLGQVVRLFSSLNESLGGIPAKVLLIAGALKLLNGVSSTSKLSELVNLGSGIGTKSATTAGQTAALSAPTFVRGPNGYRAAANVQAEAARSAAATTAAQSKILQEQTSRQAVTRQTIAPPPGLSTSIVPVGTQKNVTNLGTSAAKGAATLDTFRKTASVVGSKFSSLANSLPTGLVVAGAVYGVVKFAETIAEFTADAQKARSDLATRIANEADPVKRQKLIDDTRKAAEGQSFYDRAFGYDFSQVGPEAERRVQAPGTAEAGRRLLEKTKTTPRRVQAYNQVDGSADRANTRLSRQAEELEQALKILDENPGDDKAKETIDSILEKYKETDSAFYNEVKVAVERVKAEAEAKKKLDQVQQDNSAKISEASTSLESALADYAAGTGSILDVKDMYERLNVTYEQATASGADPTIIAEMKKNRAAQSKFLSKELLSSQAIATEYNALVNSEENSDNFALAQDLSLLDNPLFTDKSERLTVAKDIITINEKFHKAKLDSFDSATEALAYLQANPPKIEDRAQLAVIEAGLNESNLAYQEFLRAYKSTFGDTGGAFLSSLVKAVVDGEKTVEEVIAELEAKKAEAIKASGGYTDTSFIDKGIEVVKKIYESGQFDKNINTDADKKALADKAKSEAEKVKSEAEKAHSEAISAIKSQFELERSLINGDSVASAQVAVREAQALLAAAIKPEERNSALAQLNQANITLANAAKARFLARFDILKSEQDEPLDQANTEVAKAEAALNSATPDERNGAIANLNSARKTQRQAVIADEDARAEFAAALVKGDPIKSARLAQADAQRKFREATTGAQRLQAFAAKISADQDFANSVSALYDAQANVATALANFRGDSVESSRISYNTAVRHLQEVRAKVALDQAGEADVANAQADVTNAQAQLRDSQLQKQLDDYSFLYDMDKISKGQYVAYLQQLKNLPGLTEEKLRDIDRQIKGLKDELSQDLQFNVPNQIKLPTLYEARRLNQSDSGYGEKGSGAYTDNRNITFEVFITDGQSKKDVLAAINDAVASGPQRFSNGVRSY